MSLLDALRAGIKVADKVTKPLQATVIYQQGTPSNQYGLIAYGAEVELRAIVDYSRKMVRTSSGELSVTRATIDLLDVDAIVSATGGVGIGNHDKFILPDGDTGPILDISGFIDAGTGNPVATTVMLG
jgi:hypothetical protein